MRLLRQKGIIGISLTVVLLILIALSVEEIGGYFFLLMFAVVVFSVAAIHLLFDSSVFFSISLTNFIGVYSCLFIFFALTNFQSVQPWVLDIGYVLPLLAFVIGAARRRADIQSIVSAHRVREERHFGRVLRWLIPIFLVALLTFIIRKWFDQGEWQTVIFLGAMLLIGASLFFRQPRRRDLHVGYRHPVRRILQSGDRTAGARVRVSDVLLDAGDRIRLHLPDRRPVFPGAAVQYFRTTGKFELP